MKIVTYNVNGLRNRISQYGSLLKLLNSLDADIICFQETKLSKQELRADVVWADGYESFFSCTRTSDRGRTGYSGVATFCRVKSAFSSNEVALPLDAEEGFTGILDSSRGFGIKQDEIPTIVEGLEEFGRDELHRVDSEGRCIITDHGHFVLFNIYGPRADPDDTDRVHFKRTFFKILQRRWECLQRQGRRVFIVGDLNIAPAAIDRCDAGKDFEKNEFRRWFRSLLMESGGPFYDVFRAKHPERREAYTCWSTSTGAEIFNFGSRIDHILCAGSCLHEEDKLEDHNFITCHVEECDILTHFKRWKPGNTQSTRWKGGRSIKLEGSDHAPVCMRLKEIPDVLQHSTPSLSSRYCPQVQGCQQTLVSMLMKMQSAEQAKNSFVLDENTTKEGSCSLSGVSSFEILASNQKLEGDVLRTDECSQETKKKARQSQLSQLSLRSFFRKSSNHSDSVNGSGTDISINLADISGSNPNSSGTPVDDDEMNTPKGSNSLEKEKRNVALVEWQRIQQLMQNSIPMCNGHKEPCVDRVVKKAGPNLGRRFYVCARAEGPSSNPEANCGYFKWAALKSKRKQGRD
ncbi:hypothetical protein LguiB_033029 [Lonicera macranthoides]